MARGLTSRPFKAKRSGIEVRLEPHERTLLVHLLRQLDDLLDDGSPPSEDPLAELLGMPDVAIDPDVGPQPPDDPALARLFPEANRDDAEAAAEFRRFTEQGLRARKRTGARRSAEALEGSEPVLLDDEQAAALLKALTDLRLVLGERLGLQTDEDSERLHTLLAVGAGDESWTAAAATYDMLTWWQEALVGAVGSRRS